MSDTRTPPGNVTEVTVKSGQAVPPGAVIAAVGAVLREALQLPVRAAGAAILQAAGVNRWGR
jgi:hypothetical protein